MSDHCVASSKRFYVYVYILYYQLDIDGISNSNRISYFAGNHIMNLSENSAAKIASHFRDIIISGTNITGIGNKV